MADLESARNSLKKINAAIDRKMKNRFLVVFDKVNQNFSEVFSLLFPGGKGSSVVQMDGLYKLELNGAAPLGFIVREPDTVLVSTAIIMEIPMVDRVEDEFYNAVKTGDQIEINASEELAAVTMLKHND